MVSILPGQVANTGGPPGHTVKSCCGYKSWGSIKTVKLCWCRGSSRDRGDDLFELWLKFRMIKTTLDEFSLLKQNEQQTHVWQHVVSFCSSLTFVSRGRASPVWSTKFVSVLFFFFRLLRLQRSSRQMNLHQKDLFYTGCPFWLTLSSNLEPENRKDLWAVAAPHPNGV